MQPSDTPSAVPLQPPVPQQPPLTPEPSQLARPTQRHFLAVFFISLMWGILGVDRMYLGKWGTGLLKLVTVGGFGLWLVADLSSIMNGTMRDSHGQPMLEYEQYKSLASRIIFIYTTVIIIGIIITGASLAFVVMQFMNGSLPGLDILQGTGLTPDQRIEFGL